MGRETRVFGRKEGRGREHGGEEEDGSGQFHPGKYIQDWPHSHKELVVVPPYISIAHTHTSQSSLLMLLLLLSIYRFSFFSFFLLLHSFPFSCFFIFFFPFALRAGTVSSLLVYIGRTREDEEDEEE